MNQLQKIVLLDTIRQALTEDPSMFTQVIEAATEGVRTFADNQSDRTSKMAFKLFCVLDSINPMNNVSGKIGPFTNQEILQELEGCFAGTQGLKDLKTKFGVPEGPTT